MKIIKELLIRIRGEMSLKRLKKNGLKIGKNATIMPGVIIDPSHCWHVEIGDNVGIGTRVHILAHDASTKPYLNHTRVANVKIGNQVTIGAGSMILLGVTIGNNVIIGAGSLVNKDIPDNSVAAGVPAKVIYSLDEYIAKEAAKKNADNTFSSEYTLRNKNFSDKHRDELLKCCDKFGQIFVE